jgi:hypothetical protein
MHMYRERRNEAEEKGAKAKNLCKYAYECI